VFDDSATYTSLQRAFKNPVEMQMGPPVPQRPQIDVDTYDFVDTHMLINPPAPVIDVSLKRESKEEEKLPPLPPKRVKKTPFAPEINDNKQNKENNVQELLESPSHKGSTRSLTPRPQSQIIIVKSTEHLPPTKKLPPKPTGNTDSNTLPRQKKPGFFSKLFSRKKSKSDINSPSKDTPVESREPSVLHFDLADPNRGSIRSIRSLKPIQDNRKITGKPLGRSASSVSGKRPHITADVTYIPLKGDSLSSLPARSGSGTHISLPGNDTYERISPGLLCPNDRKTMSALQLADLPLKEGNMELVAIADAQSIKNLCEGDFGLELDPSVDLTEAEHFALYTAIAPHATQSEFDENSCYYAPVEAGVILTPAEMAKRLTNNNF
jgi:c-Rel proto-oncogene protein